jgi:hypothetical protein
MTIDLAYDGSHNDDLPTNIANPIMLASSAAGFVLGGASILSDFSYQLSNFSTTSLNLFHLIAMPLISELLCLDQKLENVDEYANKTIYIVAGICIFSLLTSVIHTCFTENELVNNISNHVKKCLGREDDSEIHPRIEEDGNIQETTVTSSEDSDSESSHTSVTYIVQEMLTADLDVDVDYSIHSSEASFSEGPSTPEEIIFEEKEEKIASEILEDIQADIKTPLTQLSFTKTGFGTFKTPVVEELDPLIKVNQGSLSRSFSFSDSDSDSV